VLEPADPIRARRRAREAARRRRRRQRSAAALALVLAVAGGLIALTASGGSSAPHRGAVRAAATHAPLARRPQDGPSATALGSARIRRLAQLGLPVYCAGTRGNALAFTFDDGPGPYTYLALRKLRQAHERATFFVVGRSMRHFPGWVQRETSVAAIGDHTMTHPFLPALAPTQIQSQLADAQAMIQQSTEGPVLLFRPPYGSRTPVVDATAKRLGLLEILWSVDSGDSLGADWGGIIRNVEAGMRPGAIILMHENRGQTIRALTTLLPKLHRRHLRSVSLPELLAADPPSREQLQAGGRGCAVSGARGSGG
jgi:peptidoglycan/xylan/chitin deacetylase (PgdA/CDA1 family)